MAAALALGFVVGDVVGVAGGVAALFLFPDDVVTGAMGDDVEAEAGGVPAVPAYEEILGAFAVLAVVVGEGEGLGV